MSTIGYIANLLLPPTCCLCGARGIEPGLDLCAVCLALLPCIEPDSIRPPVNISRVVVPYVYAWPADHFVRALKFGGERVYARVLGVLLANACRARCERLPELLIPVPLHRDRYRARGFNQALEIARFAAARLDLRAGLHMGSHLMTRVTRTREQSGLSLAERRRNIRSAFRVDRRIRAHRVALVDDVVTTGSTASEAASALRAAGVAEIELWAPCAVPMRAAFDYRPVVEARDSRMPSCRRGTVTEKLAQRRGRTA